MEKFCLNCEKPVRGRADKKFCDDYCRNNYNNKQNSDKTTMVRTINHALLRNRRILESLLHEAEDMKKTTKSKLSEAGFNFKYLTHQYQNSKNQVYHFIYEYGYLPLEGDWVLIVRRR